MSGKKGEKDEFAERNVLDETDESAESERTRSVSESDPEDLDPDQAVQRLIELEREYRGSLRNDPLSLNIKNLTQKRYYVSTRQALTDTNKGLREQIKTLEATRDVHKEEARSKICRELVATYKKHQGSIDKALEEIRASQLNFGRIMSSISRAQLEAAAAAKRDKVPPRVMRRRIEHLQNSKYRIQCQVNVLVKENRVLTEEIRLGLLEYANHVVQRRETKGMLGRIRTQMFSIVDEANESFGMFEMVVQQVKFLGKQNERQNTEFQNALWDAERFRAYERGLASFYETKLNVRAVQETRSGRSQRHALQLFATKEKIAKYKAGLESLTPFREDGDLGELSLLYSQLDLECQVEFARIIELDAEIDSTFLSMTDMQKKLEGVFQVKKEEKDGRKLELRSLRATRESLEKRVPKEEQQLELAETSAKNSMDCVQNIFDTASAFDHSVLGLLGTQGNIISRRNLEPAFRLLEHRISELLYWKALYTLQQGVEVQGNPLPLIRTGPVTKKKGAAGTGARIGKPKSRGGFFKPKVFLGSGKANVRETDSEKSDPEAERSPQSYFLMKQLVELQLGARLEEAGKAPEPLLSSDTESLEDGVVSTTNPNESDGQAFIDPDRIIAPSASIAAHPVEPHHSHAEFFAERVQEATTLFAGHGTHSHVQSVSELPAPPHDAQ